MRGLKLLCLFSLLKAEGVLIWNSPEFLSRSTGDSVTLWRVEHSLPQRKMGETNNIGIQKLTKKINKLEHEEKHYQKALVKTSAQGFSFI